MQHRTLQSLPALLATCAALALPAAHAQTIERVKLTDNDLSCQQIYTEIGQMDGVVAKANHATGAAAPAATPGSDSSAQAAGAAVAGAVATQAIGQAAARSGFGFGGFGGGGGFGGLFGNVAAQAAQTAVQQQAQQAAAQQAGAQQAAAAQAQQSALLAQQAQGRKEHLTGVFLSKGCKMADIQK